VAQEELAWQSKLVLLVVLPYVACNLVLEAHWWTTHELPVAIWSIGASLLLGLVVLKLRAATPMAALTGFAITASLMFSTASFPYEPWRTALIPVLAVAALAQIATRIGRAKKEKMGLAEKRRGRSASQVAANLGAAALVSSEFAQSLILDSRGLARFHLTSSAVIALGLAALSEAAADTVSSELGQVLSRHPRMITTLKKVSPGIDGAISVPGTFLGIAAAALVAATGAWATRLHPSFFFLCWLGGVFGLLFDSLLGATLERKGGLNNDAVNFLSTVSAVAFAFLALLVFAARHHA